MKVAIVTDAWGQVNGVVKTLTKVKEQLEFRGYEVAIISHELFDTIPCPSYPEIKLARNPRKIGKTLRDEKPDFIHIATEGPLGLFAKIWCDRRDIPYSTSYHTMFPEYLKSGFRFPLRISYAYFRWFHRKSHGVLVPTESCKDILESRRFKNVRVWTRGVNHDLFHPNYDDVYEGLERPILVNVGRVSQEKGLDDFLSETLPKGTKVLVGDGPMLQVYKKKYPDVEYRGYRHGEELAAHFASADIFVFPSKTDTFGLVNVEAMACGLPVLAYDVQGPRDIITEKTGWLAKSSGDFSMFVRYCPQYIHYKNKEDCIALANTYTWEKCVDIFEENLVQI